MKVQAMDLRRIALLLGGDLAGNHTILCPGPAHSRRDRSLAVRFDPRAPDGFMAYSHSGDDWRPCKDHDRCRSRTCRRQRRTQRSGKRRSWPRSYTRRSAWDFGAARRSEWPCCWRASACRRAAPRCTSCRPCNRHPHCIRRQAGTRGSRCKSPCGRPSRRCSRCRDRY